MSADIRAQINAISANPALSGLEKTAQMQQIYSARNALCVPAKAQQSNEALTCGHYKTKKCSRFKFDCCGGIRDPCHRCHLARGCEVKPPQISEIVCNVCDTAQPPSAECINCHEKFAKSHCGKCKIWTELECFHCDDCGVCRVGRKEDMFHCHTCEACFSAATRAKHRCAAHKLKDAQCPICLESVHTAQKASHILPCGHVVHGDCWRGAAQRGEYRCPTCRKSLIDMKRVWAMLRENIRRQPIPRGFFELREGDMASSPFGDFLIKSKRTISCVNGEGETATQQSEASTASPSSSSAKLCEGEFVKWRLANGECARGVLQESLLDKKREVAIYCHDCEKHSETLFHFVGLECKQCGSFNTSKE